MSMSLNQRLQLLGMLYGSAQLSKKSSEPIHREMVKLRTRQLRKENKEDKMSMHQWDRRTAPILRLIESNARWADKYARAVSDAMFMLPERPSWPSNAEDQLKHAEANLLTAIERVQDALKRYEGKPVEQLQAAE